MRPRSVVLVCLAAALFFGFAVGGHFMYRAFIGLDASAFPAGSAADAVGSVLFPTADVSVAGMVLAFGTLLLIGLVTFFCVRSSVRGWKQRSAPQDASRRSFLTGSLSGAGAALGASAVGGVGMVARAFMGVGNEGRGWAQVGGEIFQAQVAKTHPEWKKAWKGSRIEHYGRLGRTEWPVSDVVVGTGPLSGERGTEVVKLALARGANYIDTSPDYSAAGSEQAVGRALEGHPREDVFLATKFCTPKGHLPPGTAVADYKAVIESSLGRLGTDYVDLIHVHSCDEIDRLRDPNMFAAFEELKQEGKARFLGFSTHTPNLVQVANAAIDSGRFDVMMLAYHHGIWSRLGDVIRRARQEQDMGVVAMKTLKGARHHGLAGFRDDADSYAQAALKWVNSNPDVSCAVISFTELQHVDEYLYASGQRLEARDLAILRRYDEQILGSYCAPHCGACLDACPEGVPIHDVLRHRMYFEDYGWEKEAMQRYANLARDASACASCSAPCLGRCPVGIPIPERTRGTHELLRLT